MKVDWVMKVDCAMKVDSFALFARSCGNSPTGEGGPFNRRSGCETRSAGEGAVSHLRLMRHRGTLHFRAS
jgi:hypothetical protein